MRSRRVPIVHRIDRHVLHEPLKTSDRYRSSTPSRLLQSVDDRCTRRTSSIVRTGRGRSTSASPCRHRPTDDGGRNSLKSAYIQSFIGRGGSTLASRSIRSSYSTPDDFISAHQLVLGLAQLCVDHHAGVLLHRFDDRQDGERPLESPGRATDRALVGVGRRRRVRRADAPRRSPGLDSGSSRTGFVFFVERRPSTSPARSRSIEDEIGETRRRLHHRTASSPATASRDRGRRARGA